jgi:hypothetical protein
MLKELWFSEFLRGGGILGSSSGFVAPGFSLFCVRLNLQGPKWRGRSVSRCSNEEIPSIQLTGRPMSGRPSA